MGKFGELEYQFHLYGAFDAVKAEKWDWAKKEFQMLIKDNPTAEAYTGLILCELRITELHPNAVYVPGGVNAFPCPKYRKEMKSKWYCDNLDEIAAQYVKEPYFTRKDLENCFMVDEELHPVYSWFYYLWREKHKFTDWWHNSILVTKADLLATEEQKQEYKAFYDGVVANYQLWLDLAEQAIHGIITRKIKEGYAKALESKNIHQPEPKEIKIVPRANSKRYDAEYKPRTVAEKEHPKTKFAFWTAFGILALVTCLCAIQWRTRGFYPWMVPMIILLCTTVFIEDIYRLAKRFICGTAEYQTLKELNNCQLLYRLSPLAMLLPTIVYSIINFDARVFFAFLAMCVPAFAYRIAEFYSPKKLAMEVFGLTAIIMCLSIGFPISGFGLESWGIYSNLYGGSAWFQLIVVPILLHLVGSAGVGAMSTSKTAKIAFCAVTIQHVLHIIIYDCLPFEFGNIIYRVVLLAVFFYGWMAILQNHFGFAKGIVSAIGRGKRSSGGVSNNYSEDDDSSSSSTSTSAGYDFSNSYTSSDSSDPYDAADANARSLGYNDANDAANQTGMDRKDFYY